MAGSAVPLSGGLAAALPLVGKIVNIIAGKEATWISPEDCLLESWVQVSEGPLPDGQVRRKARATIQTKGFAGLP